MLVPEVDMVGIDLRRVLRRVDEQLHAVGFLPFLLADDGGWLPRRHLPVHDGRRNADALLSP
jgi:hypothetical protein